MLLVTKDVVAVRDLGSANGTYVNNKRVSEQELEAGDHLVIGPVVFTVIVDGKPSDLKPVHTRLETRSPNVTRKSDSGKPTKATVPAASGEDDPI